MLISEDNFLSVSDEKKKSVWSQEKDWTNKTKRERQDVRIEEVEQPKKKLKENVPRVFPKRSGTSCQDPPCCS
jgi:hypothetical protein